MSMFASRLKELREREGLTQTQLADVLGLAFSTISMYEHGKREPEFKIALAISEYFGVSMDYLHGKTQIKSPYDDYAAPRITEDFVTFPVFEESDTWFNQRAPEDWSGETVDIPAAYLKGRVSSDFFVLSVKDNSMYPLYLERDKVLILKQSAVNRSGDIGAVLYEDCAALKKIEYVLGEDWIRLIPVNPNHPPVMIEGEETAQCRIIGLPRLVIREID